MYFISKCITNTYRPFLFINFLDFKQTNSFYLFHLMNLMTPWRLRLLKLTRMTARGKCARDGWEICMDNGAQARHNIAGMLWNS